MANFFGEKYMILSFFCFGVIEQKIDASVSRKVTTFLLVNNSPKKSLCHSPLEDNYSVVHSVAHFLAFVLPGNRKND